MRSHVASRLDVDADDVELLQLGVEELPPCAGSARTVVDSAPGERFHGHADLRVTLYDAKRICAKLRLRSRLRVWVQVPVSSTDCEPGAELRWELGRAQLEQLQGSAADPQSLEGRQWLTRTSLRAGEPFSEVDIRPRPDSAAGAQVSLLAGSGALLIEAPGRLVADAQLGDRVRVANLATKVVVDGILLTPGCVVAGPVSERLKEVCNHVTD